MSLESRPLGLVDGWCCRLDRQGLNYYYIYTNETNQFLNWVLETAAKKTVEF